jgi:hypothetical protein
MDDEEATRILAKELARYRRESFADLQRLLKEVDAYEVEGPSGTNYQIEIQATWDDEPKCMSEQSESRIVTECALAKR